MSTETAEIVLAIITAIGVAVWISSLQFLLKMTRLEKKPARPAGDGTAESLPVNWFVGSMEVEGEPRALMEKVLAVLVKANSSNLGVLGPFKIKERTEDRIAFENPGIGMGQGVLFTQGRMVFAKASKERTLIDYALELTSSRWLLLLGWGFQAAGLLALVIGFWVIYTFCAQNLNPGVRVQTLQMFQAVHFLWPPFLCAGLYRQRRNLVLGSFETLLHNLPYTE